MPGSAAGVLVRSRRTRANLQWLRLEFGFVAIAPDRTYGRYSLHGGLPNVTRQDNI